MHHAWQPQKWRQPQIEDDLKSEDNLKNKVNLKNKDDLTNKDNLKNDNDLKNEDNLILKTVPGPSLRNFSCACLIMILILTNCYICSRIKMVSQYQY